MSEKTKRFNLPVLLGIIVLVILMASGTSFLVMYLFNASQSNGIIPGFAQAKTETTKKEKLGPTHTLGDFTVNINGSNGRRYLVTNVVVEVEESDTIQELQTRDPQLRDAITEILRSKTEEDLIDASTIKEEIGKKLNELIIEGKVKSVYLTEFVIQ